MAHAVNINVKLTFIFRICLPFDFDFDFYNLYPILHCCNFVFRRLITYFGAKGVDASVQKCVRK